MAISAISGFSPALSLIGSLSPLGRVSPLQSTTGLGGLFAIASTQTSISSVGRLLNQIETLQAAATALSAPGALVARTVAIADTTTPPLTATASAATPTGSFTLRIDQLAQAQTLTTAARAGSLTTIGSGTPSVLTFQFAAGGSRSVTLGSTDNTLAGIAAAINDAAIGIDAELVASASGVRLALSGQSGAGNAFTVGVAGDAAIADLLAYPGGSGGPALTAAARDAQGSVGGIAFNASTNSVNTAIPGLILNLQATGTATLTVAANGEAAAAAVRGFVDAFNEVQRGFAGLGGSNPALALSASLFSSQLSATFSAAGGDRAGTLALAGIARNFDGTLNFNETRFRSALEADQEGVGRLFRNDGLGIAEQAAAQAAGPLSPERLLPALTPALSLAGTFGAAAPGGLPFFGQAATATGNLASSLANQLLLANLLGTSQPNGTLASRSLVDLMLAEVLFANPS